MGRWKTGQTHCFNGHELTPQNIYTKPDGVRLCRECLREKQRRSDGPGPGRGWAKKTHCKHGHELTEDNIYEIISQGRLKRWCRTCKRAQGRKDRPGKNAQQRAIRDAMRKRAISFLGMCCAYCGSFDGLQLDHIVPRCRGDEKPEQWDEWKRASLGHAENLQLLCGECHKGKTAHDWLVSASPVRRAAFERAAAEHEMEMV